MIDPRPYIALVDALNELERVMKTRPARGILFPDLSQEWDFGGHYSIEWDSMTDRWTLVSETNEAPHLCPFNQLPSECREIDPCEQCSQNADRIHEMENDNG